MEKYREIVARLPKAERVLSGGMGFCDSLALDVDAPLELYLPMTERFFRKIMSDGFQHQQGDAMRKSHLCHSLMHGPGLIDEYLRKSVHAHHRPTYAKRTAAMAWSATHALVFQVEGWFSQGTEWFLTCFTYVDKPCIVILLDDDACKARVTWKRKFRPEYPTWAPPMPIPSLPVKGCFHMSTYEYRENIIPANTTMTCPPGTALDNLPNVTRENGNTYRFEWETAMTFIPQEVTEIKSGKRMWCKLPGGRVSREKRGSFAVVPPQTTDDRADLLRLL